MAPNRDPFVTARYCALLLAGVRVWVSAHTTSRRLSVSNQAPTQPTGWGQPAAPSPKPPRHRRIPTLAWIAIAIVGAAAFMGIGIAINSSGPPAATKNATQATEVPTSPPADTGSTTSDGGGAADITVTKVDAATREPGEFGDTPEHGWFVILHVTETGTGGSYDVNPLDFYAKASNGFHAEDTAIVTHWGPSLDYGTLHDGEHLSGTLVYDVPTRHGKLVYSPNYQGEPLASWSY